MLAGKITDDDFRPYRLRFGCYGQRQPGVQMMRTKIPGGMLTADQMERLADVSGFLRRRQRPSHHAPEHAVPLRAAAAISPTRCTCCMTSA